MLDYYACIIIGVDAYNSIKMGPTPIPAIPKMALSAFLSFFFLFEGVVFLYSPLLYRACLDGWIYMYTE
jgi:hypothetical protein